MAQASSKDLKERFKETIKKAIELSPPRRFNQSVDLVIVLKNLDPKAQEAKIRETIVLPKGRGKDLDVCLVADGDMVIKAKEIGGFSRIITSDELKTVDKKVARKIAESCDWILVKIDLMSLAGRTLGPAIGPRGKILVPVPLNADLSALLNRYRSAVIVRTRDQLQVALPIGTVKMALDDLAENAESALSFIVSKLPSGYENIDKVLVKTTQGVPVPVSLG